MPSELSDTDAAWLAGYFDRGHGWIGVNDQNGQVAAVIVSASNGTDGKHFESLLKKAGLRHHTYNEGNDLMCTGVLGVKHQKYLAQRMLQFTTRRSEELEDVLTWCEQQLASEEESDGE